MTLNVPSVTWGCLLWPAVASQLLLGAGSSGLAGAGARHSFLETSSCLHSAKNVIAQLSTIQCVLSAETQKHPVLPMGGTFCKCYLTPKHCDLVLVGWGGRLLPLFLCADCLSSWVIYYGVCHDFVVAFRKDQLSLAQPVGFVLVWRCLPVSTKWLWKMRIRAKNVPRSLTWHMRRVLNRCIGEKWAHSPWRCTTASPFILHSPR